MFRKPVQPSPKPEEAPAARRFTDRDDPVSVILSGVSIKGGIDGKGSLDLGGTVRGDVTVEGLCRVRENGRIEGSIRARQVLIEGEVKGPHVKAAEKLELRSHARVKADLEAGTVALADGCELHGNVKMGGTGGAVTFKEKRSAESR